MTSKRKILTDPPANSSSFSSSGSEEDGSSSEKDGYSSEENTPQAQTPKSPPSKKPQSSTKTPSKLESSSEEGSDSETEPEPEPAPVSQKRFVAAKPNPASPPPPKSTKRASKSTDGGAKSSKRAKFAEASSKKPEDASRGPFERLWSEADEIALLNGMIQFEKERGMEVSKDVPGFFDFIEGSLQCKVKLSQLKDKMVRLKKKFQNNKLKSVGEPKFASSHDQDCFGLSMSLWGSVGGLGESSGVKPRAESAKVKSRAAKKKSNIADVGGDNKLDFSDIALGNGQNGKQENGPVELERPSRVVGNVEEAATIQADSVRRHFLKSCVGAGAANMEEMVKSGLEMLQERKKRELEERWTKLHVEQLELYLKNLDLLKEQSRLILEELKSSLVGKL